MKIAGVYEIKNILNNKRYVGSSCNIFKRWNEHRRDLNNNKHHSIKLQRAWNKYGEKHFYFEILETCEPIKETILFLEQKYLDLNPEYNICYMAGSPLGHKHTEETKNKYFKNRSGKNNPNYGNKYSIETRTLLSEILRKRKIKEITREKHRQLMLNSEINKLQRKPVYMIDKNTEKIIKEFNSISQAALFTGHIKHRVGIKRVCIGKQYIAYNYKWKFKNDINDI